MPELGREVLEVALLVAAADDLDLRVELGGQQGEGAQQHVDLLLAGDPADEEDAVLGARRPGRASTCARRCRSEIGVHAR